LPTAALRASAPQRNGALARHNRNAQAQARHLHGDREAPQHPNEGPPEDRQPPGSARCVGATGQRQELHPIKQGIGAPAGGNTEGRRSATRRRSSERRHVAARPGGKEPAHTRSGPPSRQDAARPAIPPPTGLNPHAALASAANPNAGAPRASARHPIGGRRTRSAGRGRQVSHPGAAAICGSATVGG